MDNALENNCVIPKTINIGSKTNPVVSLTLPISETCYNTAPLLSGGSPAGGIYSGTGVQKTGNEYYFYPTILRPGSTISYSFTGSNGCTSTATSYIKTRVDLPQPFSLGADQEVMQGQTIQLTANVIASNTILWSTAETSTAINVTLDALNPVKTIRATVSNVCGQARDTVILTVPCPRTYAVNAAATIRTPVLGNYDGTEKVYTGGGVFDGIYYIVSDLRLKNGTYTLNPGTAFYVEKDKNIIVTDKQNSSSQTFKLLGAKVTTACNDMWGQVIADANTTLVTDSGNVQFNRSEISHGKGIIDVSNYSVSGMTIRLSSTDFINNWKSFSNTNVQNRTYLNSFIKKCSFNSDFSLMKNLII